MPGVRSETDPHSISISDARKYSSSGHYGPAVASYLVLFKLQPDLVDDLADEFVDVVCLLCQYLTERGNVDSATDFFRVATSILPNCIRLLLAFGQFKFSNDQVSSASQLFLRCLELDSDNVAARNNWINFQSNFTEHWHFKMINDSNRNGIFESALKASVKDTDDSVLDLGSGCGILSLLASKAGAKKVVACERSPVWSVVCNSVLNANLTNFKMFACNSYDMTLDSSVSLVVAELLDVGAFGESILPVLLDLFTRNILTVNSRILPSRIRIFLAPIQCHQVAKEHRYLPLDHSFTIASSFCTLNVDAEETYDSYCLGVSVSPYKMLAEPAVACTISLQDLDALKSFCEGVTLPVSFVISQAGRLDGIALWFEAELCEGLSLNSEPGNPFCWDQAVFPVESPIDLISNQLLSCSYNICGARTSISNVGVDSTEVVVPAERLLYSIENSQIALLNSSCLCSFFNDYLADLEPTSKVLDLSGWVFMGCPLGGYGARFHVPSELISMPSIPDIFQEIEILPDDDEDLTSRQINTVVHFPIDTNGLIRTNHFNTIQLVKLQLPNVCLFPSNLTINAVLVESEELCRRSRVLGDVDRNGIVSGFDIAKHVSHLHSPIQLDIDASVDDIRHLSDSFVVHEYDFETRCSEEHFVFKKERDVMVTCDGRVDAVIVFYAIGHRDRVWTSIDDGSSFNGCKQAAFMVPQLLSKTYKNGSNVKVKLFGDGSDFFVDVIE